MNMAPYIPPENAPQPRKIALLVSKKERKGKERKGKERKGKERKRLDLGGKVFIRIVHLAKIFERC